MHGADLVCQASYWSDVWASRRIWENPVSLGSGRGRAWETVVQGGGQPPESEAPRSRGRRARQPAGGMRQK